MNDVLQAFMMALLAGLSTGIGSIIAVVFGKTSPRYTSFTLGFSAGVMMYVSLTEIIIKARDALTADLSVRLGTGITLVSFFGGILLIALIGRLIPSFEGEACEKSLVRMKKQKALQLIRAGLFPAFAIALHNFPEGMATFVSALRDPSVAVPIVIAIAIHNIPEGIAVAVPVLRVTKSKKAAFFISLFSGITEPIGALLCWLLLMPVMSDTVMGIIFAAAAGVMVYICADEILPAAQREGEHSLSVMGFVFGMGLMAVSLYLFI